MKDPRTPAEWQEFEFLVSVRVKLLDQPSLAVDRMELITKKPKLFGVMVGFPASVPLEVIRAKVGKIHRR